jgi:hypothetical protein
MSSHISVQGSASPIYLDAIPTTCPYCHYTIAPSTITGTLRVASSKYLDVLYRCTNGKCTKPFIATYENYITASNYAASNNSHYSYVKILRPEDDNVSTFSEPINQLSKDFAVIYNQAEITENKKLDRIAGMGYRKSLEFLIKDYLIKKKPGEEEKIKSTMLGPCIQQIDDNRIKAIAERATWLGNDETHYTRKWADKDISNLKALIQLVVNYISDELLFEETMLSMPKPTQK